MSYNIYTTDALVCGSFEQNTADKSFLLFTKEAGMLFATAKSVRAEASRQRYALQDFSQIRVSLIKGKRDWRIGSVETTKNDFMLATNRETRASVVAIYKLIRRLVRGEEVSLELYDFLLEAFNHIHQNSNNRSTADLFIKLRVLSILGYVDDLSLPAEVKKAVLADLSLDWSEKLSKKIEKIVTDALEISHL